MKRTLTVMLLLLFAAILSSCQGISEIQGTLTGLKDRISGNVSVAYQKGDLDTLPDVSRSAISAFEMGKMGMLESSPYVAIDPQGIKLENMTDYSTFMRANTIIMDFDILPDGAYVQDMLSESVDRYGRVDISHERIVYSLREPTASEADAIAISMLATSKTFNHMDSHSRRQFNKAVAGFQRAQGLSADGIMGRNTAKSAARQTQMLDVKEMTSRIVLHERPRTRLYAVPSEVVKKDPDTFNRGFESMDAVKKHALTPETFQKINQPGQQFTVFVYFLDRVDPAKAVRVCLASSEHRWSEVITPIVYAPEEWPVLVESFRIDEKMGESPLFANVFVKEKYTYTCIGSYKLK